MSNVVTFAASDDPPAGPAHRRIRAASRGFAALFAVMLALMAVFALVGDMAILFYPGDRLRIGPTSAWIGVGAGPPGYVPFSALAWPQRLAYALAHWVRCAPAILLFWRLRGLFRLYARGVVFASQNARHLQWAGVALIADALAPFLCHLALGAAGMEIDRRWAHFASLQTLVLGGLVIVVAQVMQVGHEIEDERSQFV
jgi:hypothetical protein